MGTHWNHLNKAVLTSTHNLCFREKNMKIMNNPVNPSFFYIKVGCKGLTKGVYITRTCLHDARDSQ